MPRTAATRRRSVQAHRGECGPLARGTRRPLQQDRPPRAAPPPEPPVRHGPPPPRPEDGPLGAPPPRPEDRPGPGPLGGPRRAEVRAVANSARPSPMRAAARPVVRPAPAGRIPASPAGRRTRASRKTRRTCSRASSPSTTGSPRKTPPTPSPAQRPPSPIAGSATSRAASAATSRPWPPSGGPPSCLSPWSPKLPPTPRAASSWRNLRTARRQRGDPALLEAAVRDLTRALKLGEEVEALEPGAARPLALLAHVQGRLGALKVRLGRVRGRRAAAGRLAPGDPGQAGPRGSRRPVSPCRHRRPPGPRRCPDRPGEQVRGARPPPEECRGTCEFSPKTPHPRLVVRPRLRPALPEPRRQPQAGRR